MKMISPELRQLLPNPIETVNELDRLIIGQTEAKKSLSLMLLNRAINRLSHAGILYLENQIPKSNLLLLGPTGTGKTSLIRALSDIADLPISVNDVTSITAAGYIGGKVEDVLVNHVNSCSEWLQDNYERFLQLGVYSIADDKIEILRDAAETGIVYLDEIDKICQREPTSSKDVNGEMVQNELLRFLERGEARLTHVKTDMKQCVLSSIKTDNIIFIAGGAFTGLADIIYNRISKQSGIGFSADLTHRSSEEGNKDHLLRYVTTEDLIKFGFKPEFLGRLPVRTVLHPLSEDMLIHIITDVDNSLLKQYTELFQLLGISLVLEKDALKQIAKEAVKLQMGARSLKYIFEDILSGYLYDVFEYEDFNLTITKDIVKTRCLKL